MIIASVMLLCSCKNSGPNLSDTQKTEIEKQVAQEWAGISTAVEKADAQTYGTYFSGNEFIGMTSQGVSFPDWKTYIDTVGVWFGGRSGSVIDNKEIKLNVLSKRLVMLDQKSVFTANFKDGTSLKLHHVVSFLFQKQEEKWEIVHGHESWKPF